MVNTKKSRGSEGGTSARLIGEASQKLLEPYKTFRIAVSGDVTLTKLETEIVDTRDFQRLRYIKQLGTAYLVYPTALHTRFDHSLGTLHEASRFIENIKRNPQSSPDQKAISYDDDLLIRLAALLHDIGHVPFGHTLEDETRVLYVTHTEDNERREAFLGRGSNIGRKLLEKIGEDSYSRLIKILSSEHSKVPQLGEIAYIADIVNNTLCADLIDYLQRDLYFCYLTEGFGERFLKYLFLENVEAVDIETKKPQKAKRLVVRLWKQKDHRYYPRRDVLSELLNLLRVRYTLAERVYFHPTKLASGVMVARAISSAREAPGEHKLSDQDLFSQGDEVILSLVEQSNQVATKLVGAIRERSLHKLIYSFSRAEADAKRITTILEAEFLEKPDSRVAMEDELARLVGGDPGDVLICCPSCDMNKKYASMLVTWGTEISNIKELKDIREEEDLATYRGMDSILKSHDALWSLNVFASPKICEEERLKEHLVEMSAALASTSSAERDKKLDEATWKRIIDIGREESAGLKLADEVKREAVALRRGTKDKITDDWIRRKLHSSKESSAH